MTGQDASHPLFANRDRTLMITKAFIFIETTMNSLASLSQLVYAEVLMLQLRASGVGVMLHLSLKNVIGQRRRVAPEQHNAIGGWEHTTQPVGRSHLS